MYAVTKLGTVIRELISSITSVYTKLMTNENVTSDFRKKFLIQLLTAGRIIFVCRNCLKSVCARESN